MIRLVAPLLLLLASCTTVEPHPAARMPVSARPVTLDSANPDRAILGRLRYLGGLELASSDPRFGGLSSLEWRDGRLYAITDAGDWMIFAPMERGDRLEGVRIEAHGDLLGQDGAPLEDVAGDAEALTWDDGTWLVSFEREHRLLRYDRLGEAAASRIDPQPLFGPMEANQGVEALAAQEERLFLCAERLATVDAPHCYIRSSRGDEPMHFPPPAGLDIKTAFPVDAGWGADGTLYVLMRSWSGGSDNRAAIVARSPSGQLRTLATFAPPIASDNYEGLAVREEDGRTFLYIVSDDNFRQYDDPTKPETWQRTLLMKFELVG